MEEIQQAQGVEARVCEDIARRQALGLKKYGVQVADAGLPLREWLQHAYEETLDKAVYIRAAIEKIDATAGVDKVTEMLGKPIGFTVESEIDYAADGGHRTGSFWANPDEETDIPIYSMAQIVNALVCNSALKAE